MYRLKVTVTRGEVMNTKRLDHVAMLGFKSIYRYKLLMLLLTNKTHTQAQMAAIFETQKQNMTKTHSRTRTLRTD
jgi:hypothetical protein